MIRIKIAQLQNSRVGLPLCGLRPLQIIGNLNRGAGLLARKGEHLRAVRTNGNPNRQGGIAVHGSSPIRALCVIPTAE